MRDYIVFSHVWFATQATKADTQIHIHDSEGGGTEWE